MALSFSRHEITHMKKAPTLWKLEDLPGMRKIAAGPVTMTEIDNKWLPARPLGYYSLRSRLRLAYMVFTGKADALLWPGGQ